MSTDDPKQNDSFLRKVARFVANPTTDWKELHSRQESPESELAKAELRAMIERKRRNDFVRKRELDMLRRLRREGLTPEQLAAAGEANSSVLNDSERVQTDAQREDVAAVKDKIDQIEQQMVKEGFRHSVTQRPAVGDAVRPAAFAPTMPAAPPTLVPETQPAPVRAKMQGGLPPPSEAGPSTLPSLDLGLSFDAASVLGPSPAAASAAEPVPMAPDFDLALPAEGVAGVVDEELPHDPELDEAVMAFANGDNDTCERSLAALTQEGGPRHDHSPTWLVRFDFYRACGNQPAFETLALDYVMRFGRSSPQWVSLPRLLVEGRKGEKRAASSAAPKATGVNWTAPERLDRDAVALIKKRCDTAPLPWVLDWGPLRQIEAEAREPLTDLLRAWAKQATEMRWLAGQNLLAVLRELTPVGERDTDTGWWMLRLELLRTANRPDQFDEAAIDYCVTYEVSPPSWEAPRCRVRMTSGGLTTLSPSSTQMGQATSEAFPAFLESTTMEEAAGPGAVQVELVGQLVGDQTELLARLSAQIGAASQVQVTCPKLIRLDFIAAGDLLNWVLHQRSDQRTVVFTDAHRLVALFFGAMGINEHARIKVKTV